MKQLCNTCFILQIYLDNMALSLVVDSYGSWEYHKEKREYSKTMLWKWRVVDFSMKADKVLYFLKNQTQVIKTEGRA